MNTANKLALVAVADSASPLDVLAARHRAAWDRTQRGRQEWIEGTLELAAVLAEERKLLPADQDYSRWLERNGFAKISKDNRSGLKAIAADPVAARQVMETDNTISWELIGRQLRTRTNPKPRPAPGKRKSKTERQLIDKVLNMHCTRGFSYDDTAEELGLTRNQVAGIVFRNGNTNNKPAPPPPKRWEGPGLDSKTLTRKQVDPDFKGSELEFTTKYGHVLLHTKAEVDENKRQEVLRVWLAAVSDHQQSARALTNAAAPDPDTLRQWLAKPGKAERLRGWPTAIEAAYQHLKTHDPHRH
jgi:hypothetical protein